MTACTRSVVLACALLACGQKDPGQQPTPGTGSPPPPPPVDAAPPPPSDWTAACETALRSAANVTAVRRVQHVIDGCKPCGDWTPILKWNVDGTDRKQLEAALVGCKAFCNDNVKRSFMKNWDATRSKPGRQPWKLLGEQCKAAVSAGPDGRYMSGPHFALDRIARAAAADPRLAPLLEPLVLPLPAVSATGNGFDLPKSGTTQPEAGPVHISVTAATVTVGTLAHATLGKDGVVVHAPGESYPGKVVKPIDLPAAVDALAPTTPVALIGPSGVKAVRLVETIASIGANRQIRLVVAAPGAPLGWVLAGTIPIDLVPAFRRDTPTNGTQLTLTDKADDAITAAKKRSGKLGDVTIALAPSASVTDLAKLLGALGHLGVEAVAVVAAPAK